jgi:hypothetical protein
MDYDPIQEHDSCEVCKETPWQILIVPRDGPAIWLCAACLDRQTGVVPADWHYFVRAHFERRKHFRRLADLLNWWFDLPFDRAGRAKEWFDRRFSDGQLS